MEFRDDRKEFHSLAMANGWKEYPRGEQVQYLRGPEEVVADYVGEAVHTALHVSPHDGLDYIKTGADREQVAVWLTERPQ